MSEMRYKNVIFSVEEIIHFLEQLGFQEIKEYNNEFKFAWHEGGNVNGVALFKKNLRFCYWSQDIKGDLIDLIQEKVSCTFREALDKFKIIVGKGEIKFKKKSLYLSFLETLPENSICETYEESFYEDHFEDGLSKLFLDDNVGLLAQIAFSIRLDNDANRVVFPVRNIDGDIIGAIGRYNSETVPENVAKYLPEIPFEKRNALFGVYENREYLEDCMIIVESEKSVMKAFSMGYRCVVALGGLYLSSQKIKMIDIVNPKQIIIALDEGIELKHITDLAQKLKLKNNSIERYVGYINSNEVGLGYKNCIFDESLEKCKEILSKIVYI